MSDAHDTTYDDPRAAMREAVARGVALLDDRRPGWAFDMSVEKLDMADSEWCVLGQLYGSYHSGLERLGLVESMSHPDIQRNEAAAHGFALYRNLDVAPFLPAAPHDLLPAELDGRFAVHWWSELQEMWSALIEPRLFEVPTR